MIPSYAIATTAGGLLTGGVTELGIPIPSVTPVEYAEYIELGNGQVRGAGWLTCEWRFTFIEAAAVDVLRAFCSGTATPIYIRTLTQDGDGYANYSAVMVWPKRAQLKASALLDFAVEFRMLVAL